MLHENNNYDSNDVKQWCDGSLRYQKFMSLLDPASRELLKENVKEIQMLFLGEKPAVMFGRDIEGLAEMAGSFRAFGFDVHDRFIYDPQKIRRIMDDSSAPGTYENPETFLSAILTMESHDEQTRLLGRVLGYPAQATERLLSKKGGNFLGRSIALYRLEQHIIATASPRELLDKIIAARMAGTKEGHEIADRLIWSTWRELGPRVGLNNDEMIALEEGEKEDSDRRTVETPFVKWFDRDQNGLSPESIVLATRLNAAAQITGITNLH